MNGRTEAERMAAEHEAANPPVRLTDAEREAVEKSERWARLEGYDKEAATLRGLLERTK